MRGESQAWKLEAGSVDKRAGDDIV
jgi:hypothetical protein